MKIHRNLTGVDLIRYLKPYGYVITRQSGIHTRISMEKDGQLHVTIPNIDPLKIGTLSSITNDIADHFNISRDQLNARTVWIKKQIF